MLDGTKMWIINGTPGFTANEVRRKLSLRASLTAELVLEGCPRPGDAVFPEVRGLRGHVETVLAYEGTEEMHALSLGQAVTGIPAFRID